MATRVAITASSRLSSRRTLISCVIGCPVHIDWPKSNLTNPLIQLTNCCATGLSRPSCARSRSSASFGANVPLPAYFSSTISPGATRSSKNTSSATPNSVGIINSRRFRMYCHMNHNFVTAQHAALDLARRDNGRSEDCGFSYSRSSTFDSMSLCQPHVAQVLIDIMAGTDLPALQPRAVRHDALPPEERKLIGLLCDDALF